jgi:hypothetical protein
MGGGRRGEAAGTWSGGGSEKVDEEWRLRVSLAPFYSSQYQYEPFD